MAQFKVPQNIDLEDKIFGPLTLMQFLYLMGGGMIVYAAYELATAAVFWIIALPVATLTLCLAFVKIQDQPFSKFLTSAAFYFVKARQRRWEKNPQEEKFKEETLPQKTEKPKPKVEPKKIEKSELEKLAGILDTSSLEKAAEHQKIKIPTADKNKGKTNPKPGEKVKDIFA